jgi:hypothetical protein
VAENQQPHAVPAGGSQGPSVDRTGAPVIDPTQNVLDLVRAAIERQDDLREAESRHIRELAETRAEYDRQLRLQDRADATTRAAYEEKLREKETARIDAIRAVDVGAVTRAAEVSAAQAATLATQQQASADALRGQVEAARIATADALAQALAPITKSIEDLRAAQYQQQGEKSGTRDNAGDTRLNDTLAAQIRQNTSQRTMAFVAVGISLLTVAVSIILTIVVISHH